jgi:DNA damage-inducible protein 1
MVFIMLKSLFAATGVGTAPIIGRIENCPVQIGHVEFLLYFSVLEMEDDMLILGIDQMRRFNCLIDLQHNQLIFGGRDGVEVDFFRTH